jgi:hypothetical protein
MDMAATAGLKAGMAPAALASGSEWQKLLVGKNRLLTSGFWFNFLNEDP